MMSQTGPPADAKQAQAAALQELEAAQKRKRAIDTSLVRFIFHISFWAADRKPSKGQPGSVNLRFRRELPRGDCCVWWEHHQGERGFLLSHRRSMEEIEHHFVGV